jgi:hypothetical protein
MSLMMTMTNPITPPPELVQQWHDEAMKGFRTNGVYEQDIATQAAQWGADQELEACCKWLDRNTGRWDLLAELRAARTASPSLKEQALAVLMALEIDEPGYEGTYNTIRRALEALDD